MKTGAHSGLAWFCLLAALGLASPRPAPAAEGVTQQYFVQVVLGNDSPQPTPPGQRAIEPKLRQKLAGIFRCTNYWEVSCRPITVAQGRPARLQVTKERKLEVAFVSPTQREVRLYHNDKLARKSKRPISNTSMFIHAWDGDRSQTWFVVIRLDQPQYEEKHGVVE